MLTDTHTHLYWDSYTDDLDEVIKRSIDAGVTTIINVGVDVEKSKIALKQVENKLSEIPRLSAYSTIGIHPHEAIKYSSDVSIHRDIGKLEQIYQGATGKIVAVGECGLDYFFDPNFTPSTLSIDQIKDLQRKLFQVQIDLAKKLNLPLIVHCRDDRSKGSGSTSSPPQETSSPSAWDEVLKIVGTHPAILHCYSGLSHTTNYILQTTRSARGPLRRDYRRRRREARARRANLLVSFAGTITYPKNEYLREAAKLLPLERIVLETDCPFLPPQSKRGQRNEPSAVLEIAQLVASLKGLSLEEIANQTTKNVKKLFNIDPSTRSARSG